ncbi:MAG: proliferating cell nuclear antigen (pcna) [Nanoarchaeota archaeon]
MKLSLAEPRFLKDSITIISDLVSEARFKVTPDAIELIAMDPANVAMVIFKLLSSTFVEYNVDKEQVLAINLNDLKQVLKRAKPNETLTIETEPGKLKLTLKSTTTRTFSLPLIEVEEKEQKIPNLEFKSVIELPSSLFNEAIEDCDIIGDAVSLQAEETKFSVSAAGDLSKANVEIPSDHETKIKTDGKQKSKYSIEYLKKMIQGSKLSDKVEVKFSNNYPLMLEYKVLNRVQLSFILAPRVDTE